LIRPAASTTIAMILVRLRLSAGGRALWLVPPTFAAPWPLAAWAAGIPVPFVEIGIAFG
jgi:hypothetical protein